eukprot:TRINITY_DN8106_c0_g1_i1.p1 TRINITY_DN8106_c0_g1~~TRINITY_DN8106_c0_g1_i1.p1  ORF type:complete len:216 (+),score=8.43 TRINITY_DN8106_c0_g1_i1:79-726(+)
MFFLYFIIIFLSQYFFSIQSQLSGIDMLAIDYDYDNYNPNQKQNQLDQDINSKLSFTPPIIEVVEAQNSLKQQCQECLKNGQFFSPNGCEQKCQRSNQITVIQEQLDKTVVVKRVKAQCVEDLSKCMELDELGTCEECLAYSGIWNINQGCRQTCEPNLNQDNCYSENCPSYNSTNSGVCIQQGGVLCENSQVQQCVKNCEECLCESCTRFDGEC